MLVCSTAYAADNYFCGCIERNPVDEAITIAWDHPGGADGYELKISHYFYDGLETSVVETTDTSYVFTDLPKSSRHFEVKIRAYRLNESIREYSIWIGSSDGEHSTYAGVPCGWLIYTTPGVPIW